MVQKSFTVHYLSPKHSVACVTDILLQYILALQYQPFINMYVKFSSSTHLRVKIKIHSNTVNLNTKITSW